MRGYVKGALNLSASRGKQSLTPCAPRGQARISHRDRGVSSYVYEPRDDTTVYVIDSGIRLTHSEFVNGDSDGPSRAVWGQNFIEDNDSEDDEAGHGTHVAGTIGGLHYGVAVKTRLVALKVFDGNSEGTWSGVIQAVEWACNDTAARDAFGLSVINMSLGGGVMQSVNDAVANAAQHYNVTVVVAAGNEDQDVANVSPAGSNYAIAVAAIDDSDTRPYWSNFGAGVAVFAPGDSITSAWNAADDATAVLSGTSMASPHVAGLAAYFMGLYGPLAPDQVRKLVVDKATASLVTDPGPNSPNLIAFNGNPAESSQS
ncbi:peptidase S8/S53 domain-containing protein [Lasiosphaeria miniovina]|uniref:Peptidase S8/S53 domain-containing protein n=1 Tax=Lasiosphaeria miniovina TaxID=1954250 RepID=A0AA40BHY9_9PEZI|nr:peptidase S8/S53 domain-containing protein [Lasiosphaeria miniovina]KAK0734580.1 peptidase S8/S53 domain-containing protein [Lasiosphaeria miniovina]